MEYWGIDVAKGTLEVSDARAYKRRSFANTVAGIEELTNWLETASPSGQAHLVLEPTSTYHHPLVNGLEARRLDYTLVNPAHTAAFAQSKVSGPRPTGWTPPSWPPSERAQKPEPTPSLDHGQEELKALGRHLEWLQKKLRAARNRLDTASLSPWTPRAVLESLERTIEQLEQGVQRLREAMSIQLAGNQERASQLAPLTSIPGGGEQTATILLRAMPPVERCPGAGAWVAFCGLSP